MLKFVFLTEKFYIDYKNCSEIEKKENRPYINKYKKAYVRQDVERNKILCKYSTLQYFHEYIDLK